jgi:hyperosmotically inducible periplasmic protein
MKSNRLLAVAVLIEAVSFALPLYGRAQGNSIEGGAEQMYQGAEAVNDAGITSRVKTALAINPITKDAMIHVDTDNGIVSLTGNVSNASVMQEAQEIAQNMEHVKGVRNNLRVANVSNTSSEM